MSRIGNKPIAIPAGVTVQVDGSTVTVKGAKGELTRTVHSNMSVEVDGATVHVKRPDDTKLNKSLHGLTRTLVANMVTGVSEGYKKELEVNGVGYRAVKEGKDLVLNIGFSHQVRMTEIDGITIEVPAPNKIIISGPDKQKVGQFAAEVREKRPPSRIRARASSMLMSISAARKARPARAASKFRLRSEKLWLTDRTARKQDRSATPECVLRSPELQNAPALMYSAPCSTSMLRS